MRLAEHQTHAGRFLFRWRSYLPLALAPVFALAMADFHYPFGSARLALAWEVFCLAVALAGLAIRVAVVGTVPAGTSGRNMSAQRADALNTTGLYSVVRHPLYLANYLIFLGLSLLPLAWYLPVILTLAAALYYERIILVEEEFLEQHYGDAFRAWAARTPALIPQWGDWVPPALPFSWRTALKGEIYAAFAIVACLFAMDLVQRWVGARELRMDPVWTPIFLAGAVAFYLVRALKKKTTLLKVAGR
jgi:protein-S-isoprenylcysteine O-methyltransferase Ste14